jgi:hypothetical protein
MIRVFTENLHDLTMNRKFINRRYVQIVFMTIERKQGVLKANQGSGSIVQPGLGHSKKETGRDDIPTPKKPVDIATGHSYDE